MREGAISPTVSGHVSRRLVTHRPRRGRPESACVLVAQIKSFTGAVGDWIVRPWRNLVFTAVEGPSVTGAHGGNLKAKRWIGDDIDPGSRGRLARTQNSHIFA